MYLHFRVTTAKRRAFGRRVLGILGLAVLTAVGTPAASAQSTGQVTVSGRVSDSRPANWRMRKTLSNDTLERYAMPGFATSAPEVTNVSRHGFWLLLGDEEILVRFEDFPWFRQATIDALTQVDRPSPDHLYWPLLDVDLSIRSIRTPADFPLVSRTPASPNDGT
jgi:hypothetical protein